MSVDQDGAEHYEIHQIVDKRTRPVGRSSSTMVTQYRVRWRGYGPHKDEWINEAELPDTQEAIAAFERLEQSQQQQQPRKFILIIPTR